MIKPAGQGRPRVNASKTYSLLCTLSVVLTGACGSGADFATVDTSNGGAGVAGATGDIPFVGGAPATGGVNALGGDTATAGSSIVSTGGNGAAGSSATTASSSGGESNGGSSQMVATGGTDVLNSSTADGGSSAAGGIENGGASSVSTGGATGSAGEPSMAGATTGGVSSVTSTTGGAFAGGTTSMNTATGGTPSGGTSAAATGGSASVPMPGCDGHYRMEALNRGLVAIRSGSGNYVGWRMSGCEYDPANASRVSYTVYRDGSLLASVTDSTNYFDSTGNGSSMYTVRLVLDGTEQAESELVSVWSQPYRRIPLDIPMGGVVDRVAAGQTDTAYTYLANDGSPADLDGDGEYEIVLKWDPSNSRDNSLTGFTGNVILDAYKMDGTRLWRVDLGRNIRAGAHYTQFVVYDFDGDGRAEVAMKTAPGTRDGTGEYLHMGPAAADNDQEDDRNPEGRVLSGAEYLTVFDGRTGAELSTVDFVAGRGVVADWGDSYGNRVDRFLASAAFVSDLGAGQSASGNPSILMARGYYTRATISAWNWRAGTLSRIWLADSGTSVSTTSSAYGQGVHSMAVADVDNDGAQEVIYGAATIDSNGAFKCSTGFGHGDALHVADLNPSRPGLEVFMPHETVTQPSYDVHDANTCQVLLQALPRGSDTGRGVADDIYAGSPGAEAWASGSPLLSVPSTSTLGTAPTAINFLVWWDADETRELLDDTTISKFGVGSLLQCSACASNNGTKATPVLTADLLGDWREEVVWRASDNSALLLYTTTAVTARRIYTLMHDPQYRMQVSSEQTAYNQPPHPSFHIGNGMNPPPKPDIAVR